MSDLRELYQEVILDHGKRPRNYRETPDADCQADGHNPLCGDKIRVFIKLDGERVESITFQGTGCAISTASASMMSEALRGKTLDELNELFGAFHAALTGSPDDEAAGEAELGKLVVFTGVREFPMRVKCATLAWHTLRAALDRQHDAVTTE
jgi:nitrogen fixation NifU-like protein